MRTVVFIAMALYVMINHACTSAASGDCSNFHQGRFAFHDSKSSREFIFVRNDSTQTETEQPSGLSSEWKIAWENDCTYTLTLLKSDYGNIQNTGTPPSYTFEIIAVTDSYYVFKKEFNLFESGFVDTIWKIR